MTEECVREVLLVPTPRPRGFLSPDNGGTEGGAKTIEGKGEGLFCSCSNMSMSTVISRVRLFTLTNVVQTERRVKLV